MYIQIPSYCPRCDSYFDAHHPRSEGLPTNWRHPFDFPPVLDDAPPIVRYCEKCRKEPGVSRYLKVGFLLDEYLGHCGDQEYARLLRERITRETRAVVSAMEKQMSEMKGGEPSKKEKAKREEAERLRQYHGENAAEFWRDMEVLQRDGKKMLGGEGVGAAVASGSGVKAESRPGSLLQRLRIRPRGRENSAVGVSSGGGPLGNVAERDRSRMYGDGGDDVSIDEYYFDETVRARRESLESRVSSLSGYTLRG